MLALFLNLLNLGHTHTAEKLNEVNVRCLFRSVECQKDVPLKQQSVHRHALLSLPTF